MSKKPVLKSPSKVTKKKNPLLPFPVTILSKVWESPDTVTFRVDWEVKHDPGQFVGLSIPGIGESAISFCSWNEEYCEFNIRVAGTVTKALSLLDPGETMLVRGPFGHGYPMHYFVGNDLLFIGGGCGTAPLKGIIEYVEHHRSDFAGVEIFAGYRSRDDILFKHLIEKWERLFNLRVTIDKDAGSFEATCSVGFVTEELKKASINTHNKIVFICGPPIMMKNTIPILLEKGFHEDQIWVSEERHMKCCTGKCGHCMINGKYACRDGPVFRYDQVKGVDE